MVLFRILRVLKRMGSVNKIIVAFISALPAFVNALIVPTLLFLFQVGLAQSLFSGEYPELFGDFSESLVSVFLVWTLNASRVQPLLDDYPFATLFFIWFYILEFCFLKISGAILLDGLSGNAPAKVPEDEYTSMQ